MKRDHKIYLRLQGAEDARAGKSIDAFFDDTFKNRAGSRKSEGARAEYEIGYRAAKAEMVREGVVTHFYKGLGNTTCERCGNTLNHPVHGGRQEREASLPKATSVAMGDEKRQVIVQLDHETGAIQLRIIRLSDHRVYVRELAPENDYNT